MFTAEAEFHRGLDALRVAVLSVLEPAPLASTGWLAAESVREQPTRRRTPRASGTRGRGSTPSPRSPVGRDDDDSSRATSSEQDETEATRLIALVELARGGDCEAFGLLYDHYQLSIYRFCYHRLGSVALAEDLTSETFFRALRGMAGFRWQGKDFGAWLMTIARNLTADHYKAGRTRMEYATEDMSAHDAPTEGPETAVLSSLTNEALLQALTELPAEQQECLIMRFLQGLSIAETAKVLGRSSGAVKQLQLRGVRNLAKLLPEDAR